MAVYSYIAERIPFTIADVADEQISTYADFIVSTFSTSSSKILNSKGELSESIAYDYNESSIVGPDGDDYGSITSAIVDQEDYGSIANNTYYSWQQEDYGLITNNTTLRPFGILYAINNTPAESLTRISIISGVRFSLSGNSDVAILPLIYGSGYLVAHGVSSQKQTASYEGVGSLLGLSGGLENITVSYNQSSVVNPVGDDYGSIADAIVDQDDYGSLLESTYYPWQQEDYGFITNNESIFPYGNINIEGNATEKLSSRIIGSGRLNLNGNAYAIRKPRETGRGRLFKIGGSVYTTALFDWSGSGSIFKFSSKVEKRTYVYNESAYVGTFGDDYGSIADAIVDQDDYGSLLESTYYPWQQEDYGFLEPDGTLIPYGKIKIGGNATEKLSSRIIGSGRLNLNGNAYAIAKPRETGRGLFKIGGSVYTTALFDWSGSGSIFKFSSKVEKRTYVYNESAYVGTFGDDYGFINQSPISEEDYGLLSGDSYYPWQQEDYGFLEPDGTLIPYGKIKIGGSADDKFDKVYPYSGSGVATFSSAAEIDSTPKEFGKVLFRIGDKATTIFKLRYIGSGSATISNVIDKNINPDIRFFTQVETVIWNPPESTELFKITGSIIEKNTESYFGSGRIFIGEKITPIFRLKHIGSGSVKVSGEGDESYIRTPFIGSGSIFTFISAAEVSGSNPPESTELFKITGSAVEKNTEYHSGLGIINIDSSATTIFKLGHIGSGSVNVNDSANESTTPSPHVGSGSIFTFISAAEVSGSNPPESTELFKITGSAVEKSRDSYVGSGSIFTFISAAEVSGSNPPESTELFKITGRGLESRTPAPHIGTGSLFAFIGSSETITSNPSESTELFKITGSAVEKNTEVYIGSGLFDINDKATTIFSLNHIGSGSIFTFISAAEVSGSNPPETPQLFKISGSLNEKRANPHIGSGSLFTFIKSAESRTKFVSTIGLFKVTGSAIEKNVESYRGSGRLFEFGRSTQSLTYFAKTTGLFKITGSAIEKSRDSYVGSGSIFTFISAAEVSGSNPPETPQLFKVTGSAIEKNVESYRGSGRLFEFSSGVESRTKFVSTTGLFKVFGSSQVKFANKHVGNGLVNLDGKTEESTLQGHIGSGIIFTFISKTESKVSNVETIGTIKVNGESETKFNRSEIGKGTLEVNGSATTVFKLKTIASGLFDIIGTAQESFTPDVHIGSGSLAMFNSKEESVLFVPSIRGTVFTFVGTAAERNTEAYNGSGSIDTLSGSAEVFTAIYNVTKVLFIIGGSALEAYVQGSFKEEGNIILRGKSQDRYVEYEPPTTTRIYII